MHSMYVEWVAAGLPLHNFWSVSPCEYELIMDGVMLRAEREFKDKTARAYLTAMLPWQKKPIPLERLLAGANNKKSTRKKVDYDAEWSKWVVFAKAHNKRSQ